MLNAVSREHSLALKGLDHDADLSVDLERIVKIVRRQMWIILLFCVLGVACGAAYLFNAVPLYTATAVLLIEGSKAKSGLSASIADLTYDSGAIDSQLEVLKSEGIASSVLASMTPEQTAALTDPRPTILGKWIEQVVPNVSLRSIMTGTRKESAGDAKVARERAVMDQLQSGLDVRRIGRSYVLNVDYTSPDVKLAAALANAFSEVYITDQTKSNVEVMRKASGWLDQRIIELRNKTVNADLGIQKFKSEHGLTTMDGKLVSDQQLSEINTQLVVAQGDTARAEARFSQIEGLVQKHDIKGVVADTLNDPVISNLREKYLSSSRLESDIEATLGREHPQAVNLRRAMEGYTDQIFGEMTRIAGSYKSDAEVARAKENSLRGSVATMLAQNAERDRSEVQLREMQRDVESTRALYMTYLKRQQDIQEGQNFPESEARVITIARPPTAPSAPKRAVIMTLSLVLGALFGVGLAALRESRDKSFRTASQVRDGLHLDFLGALPVVSKRGPATRTADDSQDPNLVFTADPLLRHVIDHPLTSFSETLRGIKVAVDISLGQRMPKVIGIVSVAPGEGKTTVSKNLASLIAHLGAKVLLIDGDLHRRGLTTALSETAEVGLLEVVQGAKTLDEVLMIEPETGLSFLPAAMKSRPVHAGETLLSPGMRRLLEEAGRHFDYVVVDLPPIGPVVDVRAVTAMFDAFVFVVYWGRTIRDLVRTTLKAEAEITAKCVGVVYNGVNLSKIRQYEGSDAKETHHVEFSKYY